MLILAREHVLDTFFEYQIDDLMAFLRSIHTSRSNPAQLLTLKNQALSQVTEGRLRGDIVLEHRG
jgi:hypothetical protein